mmetsp:Transcript_35806/g.78175  ORF Transcript_35806/g.78175 Transcript_35806/m.78175 type:complete len:202 (+) Transcript_35806:131-736(+)
MYPGMLNMTAGASSAGSARFHTAISSMSPSKDLAVSLEQVVGVAEAILKLQYVPRGSCSPSQVLVKLAVSSSESGNPTSPCTPSSFPSWKAGSTGWGENVGAGVGASVVGESVVTVGAAVGESVVTCERRLPAGFLDSSYGSEFQAPSRLLGHTSVEKLVPSGSRKPWPAKSIRSNASSSSCTSPSTSRYPVPSSSMEIMA